jgi:hypothetical protein
MHLASLRHAASHRRKLAIVLVLSLPAVGSSEERSNLLRAPQPKETTLRPDPSRTAPALVPLAAPANQPRNVSSTLVPLIVASDDAAGAPILLIGPLSTISPVGPEIDGASSPSRFLQDGWLSEDGWLPRGMRVAPRSSESGSQTVKPHVDPAPLTAGAGDTQAPQRLESKQTQTPLLHDAQAHSTFQILPSKFSTPETTCAGLNGGGVGESATEAAGDLQEPVSASLASGEATNNSGDLDVTSIDSDPQNLQAVTDPEQNEPGATAEPTPTSQPSAIQPSTRASIGDDFEPERDTNDLGDGSLELRRPSARAQLDETPMNRVPTRTVGNRIARGVTVGDVSPDGDALPDEKANAGARQIARPGNQAIAANPIQGDRITAAGELILASGAAAANLPVLPQTAQLKATIERALRYYWDNPEDAAERTHWGMMHSIMVFDKDTQIIHRRQRYNAVAWMAGNNPCRNQLLLSRDQQGIVVRTGVGLQGHQAQLLAIFGLINVPLNYPVYAARQKFSVEDILDREMLDCKTGNELTFTLIALAHYTDSDTTWISSDQQDWDVQRVIREELSQPVVGAACGGTHRMMGFAHALRRRRAEGKPVVDQWDRADRYVAEFVDYTWSLQNRDGSMSTAWFERSEDNGKMDRKIQTTGHMLEFLMSTVPDAELQSPKMLRTVGYLANTLYAERGHQWQVGPKGHALRAIAMYYQRVFGDSTPWRNQPSEQSASAGAGSRRPLR